MQKVQELSKNLEVANMRLRYSSNPGIMTFQADTGDLETDDFCGYVKYLQEAYHPEDYGIMRVSITFIHFIRKASPLP